MTTAGTGVCALGLNRQKEAGHTCLLCCVKLRSLIWLVKKKKISVQGKKKKHRHRNVSCSQQANPSVSAH